MFQAPSRFGAAHGGAPRSAARRIALALATMMLGALGCVVAAAPPLASGDANQASCPTATEASPGFRTYLPDCRAYELVTPPYKEGGELVPPRVGNGEFSSAISGDGEHVIVVAEGAFAGAPNYQSSSETNVYGLSRTVLKFRAFRRICRRSGGGVEGCAAVR